MYKLILCLASMLLAQTAYAAEPIVYAVVPTTKTVVAITNGSSLSTGTLRCDSHFDESSKEASMACNGGSGELYVRGNLVRSAGCDGTPWFALWQEGPTVSPAGQLAVLRRETKDIEVLQQCLARERRKKP